MKEQGLVSKYTVAQFKPHKAGCNKSSVGNTLDRQFHQEEELKVVVSDLTYCFRFKIISGGVKTRSIFLTDFVISFIVFSFTTPSG